MGRALTFADPVINKLARTEFIPLTGDDWYRRRREDSEGEFFRRLNPNHPAGTSRQGIYIFTASGRLLGYRNHRDPLVMRQFVQQMLNVWDNLPAVERRPGQDIEAPTRIDPFYDRKPPVGGLIVNVSSRILDVKNGEPCRGTCDFAGGDKAARDHLWLWPDEWKALIPPTVRVGDRYDAPKRIVQRLARYHLVDFTRGEASPWARADLHVARLTLIAERVEESRIVFRIEGRFVLAAGEPARAERGFDVDLTGSLHYEIGKTITHLEMLAVGDHWGSTQYTRGDRPGRTPLGLVFELTSGDTPSDRVPPQGARWLEGYIEAEKR